MAKSQKPLTLIVAIFFLLVPLGSLFAQEASIENNRPQEVYLTFRYKGGINVLIQTYYLNKTFYLPVNSLFALLKINHTSNPSQEFVKGFYLNKSNKYQIDLKNHIIRLNHQVYRLNKNDYITSKLDYFFKPEVYKKVFGLDFRVDFNQLSLGLQTQKLLPVVILYQQEQKKSLIKTKSFARPQYPVRFKEKRSLLNGGFLDYNASMNMNKQGNTYGYYANGGIEVLGGDLQASIFGSYNHGSSYLNTSNIRWRYAFLNNPFITQVDLGQLSSNGLLARAYTGVDITNIPISLRYSFTPYYYHGTAEPNSQVELYINSRLFAIKKVDESGRFFFRIPLSYGSSLVELRVYGPNGTLRTIGRRIKIPYSYLKPGEVTYFVNAGQMDYTIPNEAKKDYLLQSGISAGLTNWLTEKIGVDYLNSSLYLKPVIYNSLYARISNEYLTSLDIAPQAYYKVNMDVTYPSLLGIQLGATHYASYNRLYNVTNLTNNLISSAYIPFHIKKIPFTLSIGGNVSFYHKYKTASFNSNLYTQLLGTTFQIGYFSNGIFFSKGTTSQTNYANFAVAHSFGYKTPFLSGSSVRSSLTYTLNPDRLYDWSLNAFKSFRGRYQLNIEYDRNFLNNYSSLNIGFRINLDKVYESTQFSSNSGYSYIAENVRGSIGYDSGHHDWVLYNRPEVGNAAASVRLFVDSNDNGKYDPGEKIIKDNAVQLWRMTTSHQDKAGDTQYYSLAPYNKYNAQINMSVISNPLLLPRYTNFAFVTAANTFRKINIPFYMTGVISGNVSLVSKDTTEALAGLNIHVKQLNGSFHKTLTTFSDGSYYSMGIPVGSYEAYVDTTQLQFLKARSVPKILHFKIKAEKDGDYVDNLNFVIKPFATGSESNKTKSHSNTISSGSQLSEQNTKAETIPTTISKGVSTNPKTTGRKMSGKITTTKEKKTCNVIQIGAFRNLGLAIKALEKMERITNHTFVICYNVRDSLFRITTDRIHKAKETHSLLIQIRKKYFPTSFIRRSCKILNRELKYMIQLASFSTRKEAVRFKRDAETKLSEPIRVEQDTTSRLYNVRLKPVSTWEAALKERNQIRKKGFRKAFVLTDPVFLWLNSKYHYHIQMGAYKRSKDAHYHQNRLRSRHGYNINVFLDKHAKLFLLRLNGNYRWQKAQILSTEIGKILGDNRVTIVGYEILQNKRNK